MNPQEDQSLSDLAHHAKEWSKAFADKQRERGNAGRRPVQNRLDAWDAVEILHAIAQLMVVRGIEK